MSPPQFTMEKKAIYDQEFGTKQKGCSTTKLCIIASLTLVSLLIVAGTAFGAVSYHYHLFDKEDYDSVAKIDGRDLPEHVHVDYHKQLIYVTNGQQGTVDALNALHNYDRKLLAFFDLTKNKCYIDRLDQTFNEGINRWSDYSKHARVPPKVQFDSPSTAIQPEILRKFAGDEIANHCRNVSSYWMLNVRPDLDSPRQKRRALTASFTCYEYYNIY